jgi:hypothetical protein
MTETWICSGYLQERVGLPNALEIYEVYRRSVDQVVSRGAELPSGPGAIRD